MFRLVAREVLPHRLRHLRYYYSKMPNRLANETSPYLLQHKDNPVNWYPWGQEAINQAHQTNRPLFISVGYSTCHWCHVMERESFQDNQIAEFLNEHFVSVKVDREERPDLDAQLMGYVQVSVGGGGWPMSVFLTPQLKPFFGGTYFPPRRTPHSSSIGFLDLLKILSEKWKSDREKIIESSDKFHTILKKILSANIGGEGSTFNAFDCIIDCFDYFDKHFDAEYGSFSRAANQPKFPTPVNLKFLLSLGQLCQRRAFMESIVSSDETEHFTKMGERAIMMVERTLEGIWRGGIHDHIRKGIHRYSVDRTWNVPHFEKMLYDQAQLLHSYSSLSLCTRNTSIKEMCLNAISDITAYMTKNLRDLKSGAFFCAEDADSIDPELGVKREGAFVVWTEKQIEKILPTSLDASIIKYHYGVREEGNVPSHLDTHQELKYKNVLYERHSVAQTAKHFNSTEEECKVILEQSKQTLSSHLQATRPKPFLDDKIVLSWNALAGSGLCMAYTATGDEKLLQMAEEIVSFIKGKMYNSAEGTMGRVYRQGNLSPIKALATDYVNLIECLLNLWQVTGKQEHLTWAITLQKDLNAEYLDTEDGLEGGKGFYSSPISVKNQDCPTLELQMKEFIDGAEPAVNTVAAHNLARLYHIMGEQLYKDQYEGILGSADVGEAPFTKPNLMAAILWMRADPLIVRNIKESFDTKELDEKCGPFWVRAVGQGDKLITCRQSTCFTPISPSDLSSHLSTQLHL